MYASNRGIETNIYSDVKLYICPNGIGPKRLAIMRNFADKNGFRLASNMKLPDVTHIISELTFQENVKGNRDIKELKTWKGHILNTKWLYECVRSNSLVSEFAHELPKLV